MRGLLISEIVIASRREHRCSCQASKSNALQSMVPISAPIADWPLPSPRPKRQAAQNRPSTRQLREDGMPLSREM
jgi:hypothetical protein